MNVFRSFYGYSTVQKFDPIKCPHGERGMCDLVNYIQ